MTDLKNQLRTALEGKASAIAVTREEAKKFLLAFRTLSDHLTEFVNGTPAVVESVNVGSQMDLYGELVPYETYFRIRFMNVVFQIVARINHGGNNPKATSFTLQIFTPRPAAPFTPNEQIAFNPGTEKWHRILGVAQTVDGPHYTVGDEVRLEEFQEAVVNSFR